MDDNFVIRKAVVADAPQILSLVNSYAQRGEVLPRKPEEVYQGIREWVVAEQDGEIVACGALLVMWADLAEVRSLVVKPALKGKGLGARVVSVLLEEARALGVTHAFTLTRAVGFFAKQGFVLSARENFPRKIWKDCLRCPLQQNCDEVAMVLPLAATVGAPAEASKPKEAARVLEAVA